VSEKIITALFVAAILATLFYAVRPKEAHAASPHAYKPERADIILYTYKPGVMKNDRGPVNPWDVGGTVEQREISNVWRSKRDRPGEPAEEGTKDFKSGPVWVSFYHSGNLGEAQPLDEFYREAQVIIKIGTAPGS
jgi:hypothetical protein